MESSYILESKDALTGLLRASNIDTWNELLQKVKALPYGRNSNRGDVSLVWTEQKGTCSSKHAFLKHVADLNAIPNVELILGLYKMNQNNTPKIGTILSEYELDNIPEAHCYLKMNDKRLDFTSINSDFNRIKNDILLEKTIAPEQVSIFKVDFHKAFLKDWIRTNSVPLSFEKVWEVREACIARLSNN